MRLLVVSYNVCWRFQKTRRLIWLLVEGRGVVKFPTRFRAAARQVLKLSDRQCACGAKLTQNDFHRCAECRSLQQQKLFNMYWRIDRVDTESTVSLPFCWGPVSRHDAGLQAFLFLFLLVPAPLYRLGICLLGLSSADKVVI